jgi:hypothetical protein
MRAAVMHVRHMMQCHIVGLGPRYINQSINVTSVAMKFMENSCQPRYMQANRILCPASHPPRPSRIPLTSINLWASTLALPAQVNVAE